MENPTKEYIPDPELFRDTAISASDLLERIIIPRELIIGTWFRQGDIGFIFGRRGEGKTFFGLALACAIASGAKLNLWGAENARKVCYVDGEMTLEAIQKRLRLFIETGLFRGFQKPLKKNLFFQHYEEIGDKVNGFLNLAKREQQEQLLNYCLANKIEVLFLDNLSCLFKGIRENEADDWEKVQPFLLDCRRNKISVVIVAHAGRSGDTMRGTSKREDISDWIIKVKKSDEIADLPEGKHVKQIASVISFDKNREGTLEETNPQGFIFTTHKNEMTIDFKKEDIEEQFFTLIERGINKCGELAEEMELSKGYISKLARQYEQKGLLEVKARTYTSKRLYK